MYLNSSAKFFAYSQVCSCCSSRWKFVKCNWNSNSSIHKVRHEATKAQQQQKNNNSLQYLMRRFFLVSFLKFESFFVQRCRPNAATFSSLTNTFVLAILSRHFHDSYFPDLSSQGGRRKPVTWRKKLIRLCSLYSRTTQVHTESRSDHAIFESQ